MAEVFISYKSERRSAAQHLARVFELYNYSVWFDYWLFSGKDFGRQIERELTDAQAVVVLWCRFSRESEWVLEEAHFAKQNSKLAPVWLERVEPPLGFQRADTIDLSIWDGAPRDHGLDRLLDEIARLVGRDPQLNFKAAREYEGMWRGFGAPRLAEFRLINPLREREESRGLAQAADEEAAWLEEERRKTAEAEVRRIEEESRKADAEAQRVEEERRRSADEDARRGEEARQRAELGEASRREQVRQAEQAGHEEQRIASGGGLLGLNWFSGLFSAPAAPFVHGVEKVNVGESLVGEGNEVAHVDLIIGPRGSAAEKAFANALVNQKDGFSSLLAMLAPNFLVKPYTLIFNKVTMINAKQIVQMFGPAQYGVAKAVADSVAEGVISLRQADDLFICVGVFIHWDANDDQMIQDFNYHATKEAIARAIEGAPSVQEVLSKRVYAKHPFGY